MCGIAVAVALTGELPTLATMERMSTALAHRGPDEASHETVDGWVALAHRRLAIIDIGSSHQPLRDETGSVLCIFNGALYNFVELREELVSLGHTFATKGDGEIIVHGYEQWGRDVFARLEGMFAAIVVDRRAKKVLLARDRFGIKPLFYAEANGTLFAASEIKAIVAVHPTTIANRTALVVGTARMHVPWPLTAFDGIFRLPPGAVLETSSGATPVLRRFASLVEPAQQGSDADEALAAVRLAVKRQLVADVPVGAFLSGGVDSTLIVALIRELTNGSLHTFSIRSRADDESEVAARTARTLGTTHHTIDVDGATFEDVAEIPSLFDEPFAETSALGVRALSRFARQHVKVALSGDGGDEVFGGYDSYRWVQSTARAKALQHTSLAKYAHALLMRRWPEPIRRLLRGTLAACERPELAQRDIMTMLWAVGPATRDSSEVISAAIEATNALTCKRDAFRRAMLSDRVERLPNAMLSKVDIASMSASLEVRVPMLDDTLVRYAAGLPTTSLSRDGRGKHVLRTALAKTSAGNVAWAAKRGFSLPLEHWLRQPTIQARVAEVLNDQRAIVNELTGSDAPSALTAFRERRSRFSSGTAAMQLLWFTSTALWAQRFAIRFARDTRSIPIV